ncbi:MAG: helix-turn-helix domain-containing protein [Patescibacteria group bacterium]|nr:helix-turn-helix domain-containing protein [Patescibacteria group bacterium]MDD5164078.1 helix-turn-helix domain-containing protein [Patescibacteria group bacterium]MDD5534264.1 helix-turn-helix domain-containing protein [Patescibacteria group bacterium]
MQIEKVLEQFNLNKKEISVYLTCLELGPSTAGVVAQKAGIKRTSAYDILGDLIKVGLITHTIKNNKKYFLAEDPEILKKILHEKERALEEVLPQLKSIYNIPGIKPKTKFYEGVSGARNIFRETLSCRKKEAMAILPSVDIYDLIGVDFAKDYVAARTKLKIKSRTLRVKTRESEEKYFFQHKEQLREMRYLPKSITFYSTILIWDDKVAIITSKKESFSFLIESQEFSQTMKALFEMLWLQSK